MESKKFKVGDKVSLRKRKGIMQIEEVLEDGRYTCSWYEQVKRTSDYQEVE
jgi:uncharacterized protein YodC (DUF2158 family)